MSDEWEDLVPQVKAAATKEPVRVGVSVMGRTGTPRLVLMFRREVLEPLGGKNWRYQASLGKGANRHLLRIFQDDAGPFEATELGIAKGGGTYRIMLPTNARFPTCKVPAQGAKFESSGKKAILVTLPSWAWDDAQRKAIEKSQSPAVVDGIATADAIAKLLDTDTRRHLCAMAKEAGRPVNEFAASLITDVVTEDAEAEAPEAA